MQVFEGTLIETVQSVSSCGQDMEIVKKKNLGSVLQNSCVSRQKVSQRFGLAHVAIESLNMNL